MSFRQRLALFLIVTLIGVQALTAVLAYGVVRTNLVDQAGRELRATTDAVARQLDVLSERVTDDVQVLSLDYALRKSVAEHDINTALSTLNNHGRRVGATRMLLVDLDGKITADTTRTDVVGSDFPFSSLLSEAAIEDRATALAALDGGIYWIVVVPVRAPVPIAFIAAGIPVDTPLLENLRGLSAIPHSLALATIGDDGLWTVVSQAGAQIPHLPGANELPAAGRAVAAENGDRLAMTTRLETAENSAPIIAILDYPLAEALGTYRDVLTPMLAVLAGALLVALIGTMLIAHSVSRPLEALAEAAGRIASGDYGSTPELDRRDEIGQLSSAFKSMTNAIAEREAALIDAVSSLEVARNEAVRASEAKSQFLSNMSHELRTPLNAIIGFAEMIDKQIMGPVSPPRYAEYARDIRDSGNHLLGQVNEMLDLAETSAGRLSIARGQLAPGTMLRSIVAALAPDAAKAGVHVGIGGNPGSWPMVEGDSAKLQQGLRNLVHNAIKFTPKGGKVTITGKAVEGALRLRIADTGIGISADDIPLIVLPFHRRKKAFDGTHQGAGIGLPFAKAILELHGGTLEIESNPGNGTVVTVTLPAAKGSKSEAVEAA